MDRILVRLLRSVKLALLLLATAMLLAGCTGEKAPAKKRIVHDLPIDVRYLHDVFIPQYDEASRPRLLSSVAKLERHLAEFDAFMHDVEHGKIEVRHGFKGDWSSYIEKPDGWIAAGYTDKLGPVFNFQKHQLKHPFPAIYMFTFGTSGYIERAELPPDGFHFDDQGRLIQWHGAK
jgi:hypothetical protein